MLAAICASARPAGGSARVGPLGGWLAAVVGMTLCACTAVTPPAQPVPLQSEVSALVGQSSGLGVGAPCQSDLQCQTGRVRSLCVLGSCTGLLSTDQRPERHILLERLRAAPAEVRAAAEPLLQAGADKPDAAPWQRLAAAEGLAALLTVDQGDCSKHAASCSLLERLAADDDSRVATASLLGLVAAKAWLNGLEQPLVRERLTKLLSSGTELARAEVLRALGTWLAGPATDEWALTQVLPCLQDPSPVVQQVAVRALEPLAARPAVRAALQAAMEQGDGALTYLAERALLGAQPTQGSKP